MIFITNDAIFRMCKAICMQFRQWFRVKASFVPTNNAFFTSKSIIFLAKPGFFYQSKHDFVKEITLFLAVVKRFACSFDNVFM